MSPINSNGLTPIEYQHADVANPLATNDEAQTLRETDAQLAKDKTTTVDALHALSACATQLARCVSANDKRTADQLEERDRIHTAQHQEIDRLHDEQITALQEQLTIQHHELGAAHSQITRLTEDVARAKREQRHSAELVGDLRRAFDRFEANRLDPTTYENPAWETKSINSERAFQRASSDAETERGGEQRQIVKQLQAETPRPFHEHSQCPTHARCPLKHEPRSRVWDYAHPEQSRQAELLGIVGGPQRSSSADQTQQERHQDNANAPNGEGHELPPSENKSNDDDALSGWFEPQPEQPHDSATIPQFGDLKCPVNEAISDISANLPAAACEQELPKVQEAPSAVQPTRRLTHLNRKLKATMPCLGYEAGTCQKGLNCPYEHDYWQKFARDRRDGEEMELDSRTPVNLAIEVDSSPASAGQGQQAYNQDDANASRDNDKAPSESLFLTTRNPSCTGQAQPSQFAARPAREQQHQHSATQTVDIDYAGYQQGDVNVSVSKEAKKANREAKAAAKWRREGI